MHQHPRTVRFAVAGAMLAATVLASCSSNDTTPMPGMSGMGHGSSTAPAAPPAASPASGPHNQADVMFAQMMIPHHQQAIEMSDIILTKTGIDPEVTDLATQIKAAQGPEITTMAGWLAGWGQNPSPSTGMGGGMDHGMGGGMMSQADMDALRDADGDDAAQLFLTGMITHHQGAIAMATQELANGQNPDAKQLAQNIIDAQQAEIATMNRLLQNL